jgi:hypothetical protein
VAFGFEDPRACSFAGEVFVLKATCPLDDRSLAFFSLPPTSEARAEPPFGNSAFEVAVMPGRKFDERRPDRADKGRPRSKSGCLNRFERVISQLGAAIVLVEPFATSRQTGSIFEMLPATEIARLPQGYQ